MLTRSRGAIVNNVSTMALAPLPLTPALRDLQGGRVLPSQPLLAGRGVRVHAVLTGTTDTDMTRGFDVPKSTPQTVARGIFDGVDNGEEEIFPDPESKSMADSLAQRRGQGAHAPVCGARSSTSRDECGLVSSDPIGQASGPRDRFVCEARGQVPGHDSPLDAGVAWGLEPVSGVVSRYLISSTRSVNLQPSGVRW